tara:strand:- start:241 stop:1803 length:1563 start_codon:yes stop_codon:yes gene_type:complete
MTDRHDKKFDWKAFKEAEPDLYNKIKGLKGKKRWTRANELYLEKHGTFAGFTGKYGYYQSGGKVQAYKQNKGKLVLREDVLQEHADKSANLKEKAMKKKREGNLELMADQGGGAQKSRYGAGKRGLPKGMEDHHIRPRTMFEPFFEGLSEAEAEEFAEWFVLQESPLGNVLENLEGVDGDLHQYKNSSIHKVLRFHNIEPGNPDGKSNLVVNERTGQINVRGGADINKVTSISDLRARMPSFAHIEDLDVRKEAAKNWLKITEEPMLNYTAHTLEKQDIRRYGSLDDPRAKSTLQWKWKFKNDAQHAAARAGIIKKQRELGVSLDAKDFETTNIDSFLGVPLSKTARKLGKLGDLTRRGENAANFAASAATGNVAGMTFHGGVIAGDAVLQSSTVQKNLTKLAAKLAAERASKSTAKLIPGVDIALSGAEAYSYLAEGKLNQAAIAALSGAIGWVPGIGDFGAALLDATNTAIDIKNLDFTQSPDYDPDVLAGKKKVGPTNAESFIGSRKQTTRALKQVL